MDILAADPSASVRRTLREVIEVLGHQPVEALSAGDLLAALTTHHPEVALIVVSWDLPGSSGADLLRRIVGEKRFGGIPIMVLLSEDEAPQAIEAFQAGATECVSRSATQQDLLTRMLECLGRAA